MGLSGTETSVVFSILVSCSPNRQISVLYLADENFVVLMSRRLRDGSECLLDTSHGGDFELNSVEESSMGEASLSGGR